MQITINPQLSAPEALDHALYELDRLEKNTHFQLNYCDHLTEGQRLFLFDEIIRQSKSVDSFVFLSNTHPLDQEAIKSEFLILKQAILGESEPVKLKQSKFK